MDRRTRRDVGIASVIGASLVVATLGVGHVFTPAGSSTVEGGSGGDRGGALVLAGGDRADGRRTRGSGGPSTDGGTTAGTATTATSGPTPTAGSGADRAGAGTTGSGSGSDAAADTGIGSSGGGATGGGSGGDASSGGGGAVTTAGVRLRVIDLSVTGTDSGTLEAGSEVRVRLSARRITTSTGADASSTATIRDRRAPAAGVGLDATGVAGGAGGAGTGDGATTDGRETADDAGAPDDPGGSGTDDPAATGDAGSSDADGADDAALPGRLDVRIRLDDDAVAALGRTTSVVTGPVALRALVDLVDGPDAATAGPYRVRVRMQLAPAQATRAAVADGARTTDGVSNVVSVTTPIGAADASGDPGTADPGDDGTTPPSTADPVEVLVLVPTTAGTSSPIDGGSVGVPIPPDATPAGSDAPTTADAAVVVHVPEAGEPIGGTPEDLTTAPPAVPTPDPTVPDPTPDTGPDEPADPTSTGPDAPTTTTAPDAPTATTGPDRPTTTTAPDPTTSPDAPATTTAPDTTPSTTPPAAAP